MDLEKTLKQVFGFDSFLPGQRQVIRRIVENNSALAVFPTGQGKSMCYQLSSILLPGLTIVVSPLMALMKDQVDFLQERSVAAARLDSSLSLEEYRAVLGDLTANRLKLLYVAPERFANERFLETLKRLSISLMVIDEAHCISEWGHNFRPDYLKLAAIVQELKIPVVLTLTATATPKVAKDIRAAFAIDSEDYINTGLYRSNLVLRFTPVSKPLEILLKRLKERLSGPAIIYVTLQATAEEVAGKLAEAGYEARAYHAGMKDEVRQEVQDWFMGDNNAIVVATIAFGMGIDKSNIRYVYHFNLPKSLENYAQEIGRAGRDGNPAICELLGGEQDLTVLQNFVYGDTPEPKAVCQMFDDIMEEDQWFSLSVYEKAFQYDMRPLVVNTLLTYLELERVIESTGPFYSSYKFIPRRTSTEMFSQFNQERVDFLRGVFACAVKGRKWFTLALDEVVEKLVTTRERIVAALNYLEEMGEIELQVAGARRGYRRLGDLSKEQKSIVLAKFQTRFSQREENDIGRIGQVVSLIREQGCKTNYIMNYFGENRESLCGHCEYCLQQEGQVSEKENVCNFSNNDKNIKEQIIQRISSLQLEKNPALQSPRQQARFLCGISSPHASRAGLTKHSDFGLYAMYNFAEILKRLE